MAGNYKNEPELLKLLNSRAAWNLPDYRKPVMDRSMAHNIDTAVRLHAEANTADPYAADRMRLYLQQGYELCSDVITDARNRLAARQ